MIDAATSMVKQLPCFEDPSGIEPSGGRINNINLLVTEAVGGKIAAAISAPSPKVKFNSQ